MRIPGELVVVLSFFLSSTALPSRSVPLCLALALPLSNLRSYFSDPLLSPGTLDMAAAATATAWLFPTVEAMAAIVAGTDMVARDSPSRTLTERTEVSLARRLLWRRPSPPRLHWSISRFPSLLLAECIRKTSANVTLTMYEHFNSICLIPTSFFRIRLR
jgi:hypothetical protein